MNEELTEDTVATEEKINTVLLILPWIILILTLIRNGYASRKAGKSWEETITILLNTLKDEEKMTADGGFSGDALTKAKEVAAVIGAGKEAQAKAEEALSQGREKDIKVGSINGKPIYLGNVLGIGSALSGVIRGFRK